MDPAGAREMCLKLSDFLRTTLRLGEQESIEFGHELKLAQIYLEVEQVRFGKRLRIEREVDPRAESARVPPLIVQPLVENAVKHGLEPKLAAGTLRVSAGNSDARLRIVVADDGVGFGADTAGSGTGIANVRARLAALYGDGGRLMLEENPKGGVTATLELPA